MNARIEELESHKVKLIDKLTSLGVKGDRSYIIETQKLDKIKPREIKDGV